MGAITAFLELLHDAVHGATIFDPQPAAQTVAGHLGISVVRLRNEQIFAPQRA